MNLGTFNPLTYQKEKKEKEEAREKFYKTRKWKLVKKIEKNIIWYKTSSMTCKRCNHIVYPWSITSPYENPLTNRCWERGCEYEIDKTLDNSWWLLYRLSKLSKKWLMRKDKVEGENHLSYFMQFRNLDKWLEEQSEKMLKVILELFLDINKKNVK